MSRLGSIMFQGLFEMWYPGEQGGTALAEIYSAS